MTKPRRIILLVVDIVTLLGGLVALIMAAALFVYRTDISRRVIEHQEIYSSTATHLQTKLQIAADDILFLHGMVEDSGGLFLFCGTVMFLGSILRLLFTPWRLSKSGQ